MLYFLYLSTIKSPGFAPIGNHFDRGSLGSPKSSIGYVIINSGLLFTKPPNLQRTDHSDVNKKTLFELMLRAKSYITLSLTLISNLN